MKVLSDLLVFISGHKIVPLQLQLARSTCDIKLNFNTTVNGVHRGEFVRDGRWLMNLTSHTESVLASVNCRYTSATRNEVNP